MRFASGFRTGVAVFCVTAAQLAGAQEIVHALSGTVEKIDSAAKTLVLKTNDDSEGTFRLAAPKFPSSSTGT